MRSEPPPSSGGLRLLPRKFAHYTLFDCIGSGGMAQIFLARVTTNLGGARLVAVKQIHDDYAGLPRFADMLIGEAKLAAQLNHANVTQVFDLGREDGHLFIAMEYVEGFDLNYLLRRCQEDGVSLPVEFAVHILGSALRGLDYAHRRKDENGRPLRIVHRDVSPSNFLISFSGDVKICDFGIAHANEALAADPERSQEAIQGKAGYMSPEHAAGEPLDARADVFAAGIVLWEMLAGRRMYRRDQARATLLEQACRGEVPELPALDVPNLPAMRALLGKAMALDPSLRFHSAAAMLRELEGWAAGAGKLASPLRLGEWLATNFGEAVLKRRRLRERAAAAFARGPLVVMTPLGPSERAALEARGFTPSAGVRSPFVDETSSTVSVELDSPAALDAGAPPAPAGDDGRDGAGEGQTPWWRRWLGPRPGK